MTQCCSPSTLHFSCARSSHRAAALAQHEHIGLNIIPVLRPLAGRKRELLQQLLNPRGPKTTLINLSRLLDKSLKKAAPCCIHYIHYDRLPQTVFPIPKMRYQRDKDKLSDGPEKQKNIHMNGCPGFFPTQCSWKRSSCIPSLVSYCFALCAVIYTGAFCFVAPFALVPIAQLSVL